MRALVIGRTGQLGGALVHALAPLASVVALDRAALDLADAAAVARTVRDAGADVVLNAAACTNLDEAQADPARAARVNADAPAAMAQAAARAGALLVHYSTDYVFDGTLRRPYREDDPVHPLGAYGEGKRRGEEAVLAAGGAAFVFRVAWVFSRGGRNFLSRLDLLARARAELCIDDEQVGTPSWAPAVAQATAAVVARWLAGRRGAAPPAPTGLYHLASPDTTTRFGFAQALLARTGTDGHPRARLVPVPSAALPAGAPRPPWSVLDSGRLARDFGIALPPWREQLARCLSDEPPAAHRDGAPAYPPADASASR